MKDDRYQELSARFRGRLVAVAVRWLRDAAAAQDVAQETLRRVGQALDEGRLENADALPSYVYETARHVCQEWSRRRGREGRALERLAGEPTTPPVADALAALVGEERSRVVLAALSRLDDGDREILRMAFWEDLDSAQMAGRLGTTPGALRVRKHRALERLRQLVLTEKDDVTQTPEAATLTGGGNAVRLPH